jgi:hypothetical protein
MERSELLRESVARVWNEPMRSLAVVLVLASACGRLEYARVDRSDAASALDGAIEVRDGALDGADARSSDGGCAGSETCDGLDDDCDRIVDEGCPCTPFQTFVSPEGASIPYAPFVVWTGTGYGVIWNGPSETGARIVLFRAYDALGAPRGTAIDVSRAVVGAHPHGIAWNGSQYGVLWVEVGNTVAFATVDADGATLSPTMAIGAATFDDARIAPAPDGFLIATVAGGDVEIRRVVGGEQTLHPAGTFGAAVARIGFAADDQGAMVIGSPGAPTGPALALGLDPSFVPRGPAVPGGVARASPSVIRAGSAVGWLVALENDDGLALRPIDDRGVLRGTEAITVRTLSNGAALARAGTDAVVAVSESNQHWTMRVDADTGAPLEPVVFGGTLANPYGEAQVAGAAGRIAVAWLSGSRIELVQRCF